MSTSLRSVGWFVLALFLSSASRTTQAAIFMPLGDLPGGEFDSVTTDISDDGLTVVGFSVSSLGTEAYRWTEATGMVALSSLTGESVPTIARAVALNGTVAGQLNYIDDRQCSEDHAVLPSAALWTEDFGFVPVGGTTLIAHDLSADGSATTGRTCEFFVDPDTGEVFPFGQPYHWSSTDGLFIINAIGEALGMSADGNVIAGFAVVDHGDDTFSVQAFRWSTTDGGELLGLVGPSIFPATSFAYDISADGRVIVGGYEPTDGSIREGYRWTEDEGFLGLGRLADFQAEVFDVSEDGNVIVGEQFMDEDGDEAFATIWDPVNGLRDLRAVLVNDYGLGAALEGWHLTRGNGISADGLSIVGFGVNPEGNREGFLIRLDELPPVGLLGDYNNNGAVEQADLDLVLLNWGQDATPPPAGWTNNLPSGAIDQDELDGVLLNWGNTAAGGVMNTAAAVPEPATLVLLAAVLFCMPLCKVMGRPR